MSILQTIHRIGLAIATVLLIAGLALFFVPETALSLPLPLLFAKVAGLFAILLALWLLRIRYRSELEWSPTPDVEFTLSTPAPGNDIDDLLYRMIERGEGRIEYREQIQERLSEVAATIIMNRESISYEGAVQQLEEGTWTESGEAAAFFGAARGRIQSGSIVDRIQSALGLSEEETVYETRLRAAVDELEDISGFFEGEVRSEETESRQALSPSNLADEDSGERVAESVRYRRLITTNHWRGIGVFALMALAVGLLAGQSAILIGSGIAIAVAGYGQSTSPPSLAGVTATRTASDENPDPGDEVDITVTVENNTGSLLTDLRVIDQVPATVEVVDGSARLGTALRPGGTATFGYTIVAERGTHSWPVQVLGRDISGANEREALVDADFTLECAPSFRTVTDMPVRLQTSVYAGEVNTNIGGEGLEFFSVRDYQPGDPKRRIDWKTYARTGEFSTIDFREENAARVTLMFDSRESSYVSPEADMEHALNRSVTAAIDIYASLNDQGHLVGIAAFNGIPCWLAPDTGTLHTQRVRELFADHPAVSSLPPNLREKEAGQYIDPMIHIRQQLPQNTQIFLFSPLTDHYTYETARRLDGAGHLVTMISPNPTNNRTIGERIARLERTVRVQQLREYGIRIVDWESDQSLNVALEYALRRWQA